MSSSDSFEESPVKESKVKEIEEEKTELVSVGTFV